MSKENKEYFVSIDGEQIPVSEEIYRAFKRPAWAERKRREVRAERERSLEAFADEGLEFADDAPSIEDIVADKLLLETLYKALAELTEDERGLIDALFFDEKSEREVARETGVPRKTLAYRRDKALAKLKKILGNC
jgi:RNA polymerase sigma factor (sigma-70 family)